MRGTGAAFSPPGGKQKLGIPNVNFLNLTDFCYNIVTVLYIVFTDTRENEKLTKTLGHMPVASAGGHSGGEKHDESKSAGGI
ncbi:hypothetical protein CEB3_c27060 [Peptococcaceae bacterium CEB3]|nr:hypothetical protein CEB3_c27060 [Peptococcaceae bacterium CEB3]